MRIHNLQKQHRLPAAKLNFISSHWYKELPGVSIGFASARGVQSLAVSQTRLKSKRQSETSAELILGKLVQLGPSFLQALVAQISPRLLVLRHSILREVQNAKNVFRIGLRSSVAEPHITCCMPSAYDTRKLNSRPRRRTTSNPEC